jgi:hypothetical protein|eukprot:COSAG01_NODE_2287_length_7989_cov_492.624968_2_plen_34_part_00
MSYVMSLKGATQQEEGHRQRYDLQADNAMGIRG